MSESTQTSQADLCDVKRCSCVVFSLKPLRKDLTNRHKSLPLPHPPPSVPADYVKRILAVFCRVAHISCIQILYPFFQEGGAIGGQGVCVCVGGENFRPVCQVFSPLLSGKKQHRNIFSHHTGRLAKFGWILKYLKISVEMALT